MSDVHGAVLLLAISVLTRLPFGGSFVYSCLPLSPAPFLSPRPPFPADDDDDEVRDRATMFLRLLGGSTQLPGAFGGSSSSGKAEDAATNGSVAAAAAVPAVEAAVSKSLTSGRLPLPVSALQKALSLYQLRPAPGPFSFAALPHVEIPASATAAQSASGGGSVADVSEGFGYNSEIR